MKYLVTGSTGNLARKIVAQGDDVLQVDLREPRGIDKRTSGGNR
ncbi:MAG: hypothetical protein ACOC2D_17940 [Spirochaetota bacterium]